MATEHNYSVEHAPKCGNEDIPVQFKDFDDTICQFMKDQGIPGLAVAVSYHGNLVHSQGYGIAGVNRPMTSSSRLRIASISKPLTAIGVMQLVELGQLTLEDKVFGPKGMLTDFRPTYKGDKRVLNITVRHLLQHSAGWDRDQAGDPVFFNLDAIGTRDGIVSAVSDAFNVKLVKYMMKKKLQFAPGKRHAYSNFGYLVLGLVIEKETGIIYEKYMRKLFISMGLPRLRVGCTKRVLCDEEEVEYFNNREPAWQKSIFLNEGQVLPQYGSYSMENTGAYGGWVASTGDLISILHMLQRDISLQIQTGRKMNPFDGAKQDIRLSEEKPARNPEVTAQGVSEIQHNSDCQSAPGRGCNRKRKGKKHVLSKGDSLFKQLCEPDVDLTDASVDYVVLQDFGISCSEVQIDVPSSGLPPEEKRFPDKSLSETLQKNTNFLPCSDCHYTSFGLPILDNCYVIEHSNLEHSIEDSDPKDHIHMSASLKTESRACEHQCILSPSAISQMLKRPSYEEGKQWYGLGLDVQDTGESFGHTGAMEGSCGTMMHHKSGFSWVLLMNAWSRDMDLDGLVKYALSTVKGYPLFFQVEKERNLYEVISQDEQEQVLLLVPQSDFDKRISDAKESGFAVSWINITNVNSALYFNIILRQSTTSWSIHRDINSNDISSIVKHEKQRNYYPYFLESYILNDQISHCIIFKQVIGCEYEYEVLGPLPAKEYLEQRTVTESKCELLCQSVTPFREELFVSALIKASDLDCVSWLQITAEEFLVEQKKQFKKKRNLVYVKFYSLGEDPFVSAVWSASSEASDRLQRYGASKYGLIQELRDAAAKNVRLQACSSYVSEGVVNFAALWNPTDAT